MNLQSSITELKGIGEKTSLPFAKVGIHTVLDLLEYYPRDYEIYEEPVELTEIESGKKYAVHGFVESVSEVKRFGKYQIFSARLRVVYFSRDHCGKEWTVPDGTAGTFYTGRL